MLPFKLLPLLYITSAKDGEVMIKMTRDKLVSVQMYQETIKHAPVTAGGQTY